MRLVLAFLVCFGFGAGCADKAATAQCDLGCRNYFKLHYWQEAEREIAGVPEAERAALRKKFEGDLEARMQKELELCVTKCKSGATKKRVQCWIDAKTAAEAMACKD
jgi:hypothetical protein